MGAYTPSENLTEAELEMIERDVFVPVIDAMRRNGITYRGVLYAGLMMTPGGPKVLEFNCRFGDPEAQPILMRLQSDLVDVILATIEGRLADVVLQWDQRNALCVVMASGGYPGAYEKGKTITGLEEASQVANTMRNCVASVKHELSTLRCLMSCSNSRSANRQRANDSIVIASTGGPFIFCRAPSTR